jgi:hypothetical protein
MMWEMRKNKNVLLTDKIFLEREWNFINIFNHIFINIIIYISYIKRKTF